MTREEAKPVLDRLDGDRWLIASLPYGAGLRLMECPRLRVKDVDFSRDEVTVRQGKGGKDRVTMLPNRSRRRSRVTSARSVISTQAIWPTIGVECRCPTPWIGSIPTRPRPGLGSGCSPGSGVGSRNAGTAGGLRNGHCQARGVSHFPPFLRHLSSRSGLRYWHHPGATGSQGCQDHHDLHPRIEQGRPRREKAARRVDPRHMQSAYLRDCGAAKRFSIQWWSDKRGVDAETAVGDMQTEIAVFVEIGRLDIGS
jgi:hypothetical protein